MNNPPNGAWKIMKPFSGSGYQMASDAFFWNGTQYVDILNIRDQDHELFMQNPAYAAVVNGIGSAEIDIVPGDDMQGGELPVVDAIARRIKKVFSKESYDTPKKKSNAIFIIIFIVAAVLGYLIYTKKIKI